MKRTYHASRIPLDIEINRLNGRRRFHKLAATSAALFASFILALLLWLFVEQVQTGHNQTLSEKAYWEARR
jgi:hypothetical protein